MRSAYISRKPKPKPKPRSNLGLTLTAKTLTTGMAALDFWSCPGQNGSDPVNPRWPEVIFWEISRSVLGNALVSMSALIQVCRQSGNYPSDLGKN
jgi:hypothetical protein